MKPKMTPKEAKEALKLINLKSVHPFYSWEEMMYVRDTAIEALEKQVPKKPVNVVDHLLCEVNEYDYSTAECPNCRNEFCFDEYYQQKYCEKCGQAIEWEEGEADA